jgi:capsular polysaccharide biosynthesis protein
MSALDPDAERDVDLARWGRALIRRWWILAAGLVIGAVIGALISLSGGTTYEATARIAPGQAFNPSGNVAVLTYLTNKTAVNELATSEATIDAAAQKLGIDPSKLRDHITTEAVTEGGASAGHAVLIDITAELRKKQLAEDAANVVARLVQQQTTSHYAKSSLKFYAERIKSFSSRLKSLQARIDTINAALKRGDLTLDERLLLTIQADQAQATQGQTIDSLSTAQQQQLLSQTVEQTQIIQDAKAAKSVTHSKRPSTLVGAVIGLIIGAIVAIVVETRAARARRA